MDNNGQVSWSKEHFFEATEKSLERLGVNSLDLYYFHRMLPKEVVSVEEMMEAMKELVTQGKVERVGLSEASPEQIRRCHKVVPITTIQQEWSLFAYDLEEEIVPLCKELGIGIVSYSPVARGFLTGILKSSDDVKSDWRARVPYLQEENIQENHRLLDRIQAIANKKNCTLSQICIAWVMAQGAVPIPGTTKVKHIQENVKACDIVLAPEEIEELRRIGRAVKGLRGDKQYMSMSFQKHAL